MGKKITFEQFKERATKLHNGKYTYNEYDFIHSNEKGKIKFTCPIHGEFWQSVKNHLNGYGCKKCGRDICGDKLRKTLDQFIIDAKKMHGDNYDYSRVVYKGAEAPVIIICPIHGEFFQTPHDHLKGAGCPTCGAEKVVASLRYNNEDYIKRAAEKHNGYYSYGNTDVDNRDEKGKIIVTCPIHGDFKIDPVNHLNGQGCRLCGYAKSGESKKLSTENFERRATKIHNGKYKYLKIYNGYEKEVPIQCPEHGIFWQTPHSHLGGSGCPECNNENRHFLKLSNNEEFIKKAKMLHGNKYDYSKVVYDGNKKKVIIICPIHGEFCQTPDDHLQGKGCPHCGNSISRAENEIAEFCSSILGENKVQQRNRTVLNGKEIDIYLPTLNYGIEYNGLRWHSEEFGKDKWYHLNKTKECNKQGIKLLQIFEDEYTNHKDIVMNKIAHIMGVQQNLPKIMGRKCIINEIKNKIGKEFLDKYHIQKSGQGKIYLGAYFNDNLIAVMSFKEETKKSNKWELTRFASDYHYICQGVGGKLFKYFIKKYNPDEVKSFADRRWTINEENNLYTKLGFKFEYYTDPEYRYINIHSSVRYHKFGFRKKTLIKKYGDKYGLTMDMTESQMVAKVGFYKIWDCGLIKYVWKSLNNNNNNNKLC